MSEKTDHLKPSAASLADSDKTAAVSKEPSVMDYEKTDAVAPETATDPRTAPGTAHSKDVATVDDAEQTPEAEVEAEHEYPKAWRLGVITIALCLSVFCMALVLNPSTSTCIFTAS